MTRQIIEERNMLKRQIKALRESCEEKDRIISKTQHLLREAEKEIKLLKNALSLSKKPLSDRDDLDGTGDRS